jgi:hypothetical protein
MITLEQYKRELKEFFGFLMEHAEADYKALDLVAENTLKLGFDVTRILNHQPDIRPLPAARGKNHGK